MVMVVHLLVGCICLLDGWGLRSCCRYVDNRVQTEKHLDF